MHTRLHGVLHFAAPSYLGSQEEIFLLPKKTRLCASRPQQPLSRESERETFFPTQSPAHKKKKNKKNRIQNEKNSELKFSHYKYSNLEIQITVSNRKKLQTNPKIFAAKNNFAATANPKALAKPTRPRKKLKKPYNRWIIYPLLYTHWKSLKDTCTKKCTTDNR
jgi:hypothetical protein